MYADITYRVSMFFFVIFVFMFFISSFSVISLFRNWFIRSLLQGIMVMNPIISFLFFIMLKLYGCFFL